MSGMSTQGYSMPQPVVSPAAVRPVFVGMAWRVWRLLGDLKTAHARVSLFARPGWQLPVVPFSAQPESFSTH
jgi:hypothetical protein